MALKDVAAVLAKDFVDVKIDTDRMTGGEDVRKRFARQPGGIPWFVFLDGNGKPIITSDDPDGGNIGFPTSDPEIAYFKRMIQKVAKNITASDIEMLEKSLVAFREVKLPQR